MSIGLQSSSLLSGHKCCLLEQMPMMSMSTLFVHYLGMMSKEYLLRTRSKILMPMMMMLMRVLMPGLKMVLKMVDVECSLLTKKPWLKSSV